MVGLDEGGGGALLGVRVLVHLNHHVLCLVVVVAWMIHFICLFGFLLGRSTLLTAEKAAKTHAIELLTPC